LRGQVHLASVCARTPMFTRATHNLNAPVQTGARGRPMRSPRYPSAWLKPAVSRAGDL
jgi:hypothetical protein